MTDTEPKILSVEDLIATIKRITIANSVLDFDWRFEFEQVQIGGRKELAWLVWVSFTRADILTGVVGRGRGREEIVWQGATISSVVKTCWVLIELMIKHELMEAFRFDDARIFNPHNSVFALKSLQQTTKD